MRKFKTAEKNRTNYVYYTAEEKKIVLTPDDVDRTWIAFLHGQDDEAVDAERREDYHVPVHYDSYSDGEGNDAADRNFYMEDDAPDPFESLIQSMDAAEHEDKLKKLKVAIETLQLQQKALIQKVFYQNRTNVDIAAEEGVSETAIRNRLKKIYANLAKKI
jgi:RNA polymerase sigma factor (sigma-70 family)